MSTLLRFVQATPNDCERLATFATHTFTATFGHLYTPENLASHLAKNCSAQYFRKALSYGDTIILGYIEQRLIAYGKLGKVLLPVSSVPDGALEIHRVYIDPEFQSHGYGKALFFHLLSLPAAQSSSHIYLGVWEENVRAQALYHQYGFTAVGRYLYHVGTQSDREIIMLRKR